MTSPWQPSRRPNDGTCCNCARGTVLCVCVGVCMHLCVWVNKILCIDFACTWLNYCNIKNKENVRGVLWLIVNVTLTYKNIKYRRQRTNKKRRNKNTDCINFLLLLTRQTLDPVIVLNMKESLFTCRGVNAKLHWRCDKQKVAWFLRKASLFVSSAQTITNPAVNCPDLGTGFLSLFCSHRNTVTVTVAVH